MTDKTMTQVCEWHRSKAKAARLDPARQHEANEHESMADAITRHVSHPAECGEAVALPVPSSIDTSHKNQAFVTLGFGDQSQRDAFVKATRSHRTVLYTAPPPAAGVPDGWKLVPVDSTHDMICAGMEANLECAGTGVFERIYKSMISAAPEATPSPTIDVAAVRDVCHVLREITINGHAPFTAQADKLARAIGDAK